MTNFRKLQLKHVPTKKRPNSLATLKIFEPIRVQSAGVLRRSAVEGAIAVVL